jgi:hypothetical protein
MTQRAETRTADSRCAVLALETLRSYAKPLRARASSTLVVKGLRLWV